MRKPVIGLMIGAILGLIDGLGAFAYPGVATMMTGIIIGSTFKGLITGAAVGFFATRFKSLPMGIVFGLAIGLILSGLVAATSPDPAGRYYYFEIMIPGAITGCIVGYATQRFGATKTREA